jgi:hypothetical protein
VNRRGRPPRPFFEMPIWHLKKVAEDRRLYERKVPVIGAVGGCGAWLRRMVDWEQVLRREEGNAHSPPDIHYSKEPNKGKRLLRRPAPSQEPAGKAEADAAEKNSEGGDSAIPRGQSGRERGSGRLCVVSYACYGLFLGPHRVGDGQSYAAVCAAANLGPDRCRTRMIEVDKQFVSSAIELVLWCLYLASTPFACYQPYLIKI